jgi:hypothetical protein
MQVKKNYTSKCLSLVLLTVSLFMGNGLHAQKYKPYILIESSNGISKVVYENQKITFVDSAGQMITGKIHIYNDTQFCFINFFNEVDSDTFHLADIYQIYLKSNQTGPRRKVPLIVPILGIIFVPYIAIPVILITYLAKGTKNKNSPGTYAKSGWYKKSDFKVSVKDLYPTI